MEEIQMSQITSLKLSDPKWEAKNMPRILKSNAKYTTKHVYNDQAMDFLSACGIVMKVKFLKHDKHFIDDKDFRDIYRVTFLRGGDQMSITFGQSIKDSTTDGGYPPNAYDVLTCLTKYDPGTFENFCGDMGYNEDSIKDRSIYKSVVKEWKKMFLFFTESELTALQEIQ
jgi:hypothetical protein